MFGNSELKMYKEACKKLQEQNDFLIVKVEFLEKELNAKQKGKASNVDLKEVNADLRAKAGEITKAFKTSESERKKLEFLLKDLADLNEANKRRFIDSELTAKILKEKLEELTNKISLRDDEIKELHKKVSFYNNNSGSSVNLVNEKMGIEELKKVALSLGEEIKDKRKTIVGLDEQIFFEEHGFYSPKYKMSNSEEFRNKLKEVQDLQKAMIREKTAMISQKDWAVGGDYKLGKKMIAENQKLMLRCFNNECESAIAKLKVSTYEAALKKIEHAYDTLNNFGESWGISISLKYFHLKNDELQVAYEYELMKQKEKEDAALERERLKEIAKIEKELEEARLKNEKEKIHLSNRLAEIAEILSDKNKEIDNKAQERIIEEQKIIEAELKKCEVRDKELDYREQNQSAGYVYIISNVGAFGENIYKIGVTRRLDPNARIDELGSASVPFRFDTHALIFSEKAFQLENALHKAFEHKRVNLVNRRKEFFNLDLNELNEVLKQNFNKHFELKMEAEAKDFRESIKLREMGEIEKLSFDEEDYIHED